jgi:4-aminobutyrate aminotransferase/(S)-3-amino-2-methylpropionate transaminase
MFRDPFLSQRGRFTEHIPYSSDIEIIDQKLETNKFGAVIVEPTQGRGGIQVPPTGWLTALQKACTKTKTLLILDEIYTGWGRTGKLFACQHEGNLFNPDLICIGKAMGGGMPISACVGCSEMIDKVWPKSQGEAIHTSTFLGHPVACAAAIAAIDIITNDNLPLMAKYKGEKFIESLNSLAEKYPHHISEIRGKGLMLGLQMRSNSQAKELMLEMLRSGLILLLAGENGDVAELTPPLIITDDQINWILEQLSRYFAKLS